MQNSNETNGSIKKLAFPDGGGTFVHRAEDGYSVVLNSSSEWSRKLGNVFRLHSSRAVIAPASLAWARVPLYGIEHVLVFSAKLAVDYSMPAYVVLKASADGKLLGAWSGEIGHESVRNEIVVPAGFELLDFEVEAFRFSDLSDGQVSAIDIEQVELVAAN